MHWPAGFGEGEVELKLTRAQVALAVRCIRQERRKSERSLAKSTFVPEPGKANAQEMAIQRMKETEEALWQSIGER